MDQMINSLHVGSEDNRRFFLAHVNTFVRLHDTVDELDFSVAVLDELFYFLGHHDLSQARRLALVSNDQKVLQYHLSFFFLIIQVVWWWLIRIRLGHVDHFIFVF